MTDTQPQGRAHAGGGMGQFAEERFDILKALGGPLGLVESVLPYLVFSIVFGITRELRPSIYASAAPVVVLVLYRIVRRESVAQSLGGVIGIAIGAFAALKTGDATNFILPNILKNIAFALAYLVSVMVRWPLLGLVVGSLTGAAALSAAKPGEGEPEPTGRELLSQMKSHLLDWRKDPVVLAAYGRATWIWVGMFVVRVAVQTPLYLADQAAVLALVNALVLGAPLFLLTLYLSWLVLGDMVRATLTGKPASEPTEGRAHPETGARSGAGGENYPER